MSDIKGEKTEESKEKNDELIQQLCTYAAKDDIDGCRRLIKAGANPNGQTRFGQTPLTVAAYKGYCRIITFLLQHGADSIKSDARERTALHHAATHGHREAASLLLDRVGSIYLEVNDKDGFTPLHNATSNGHFEVCKLLVERGANINARNKFGNTPVYCALTCNINEDIALFLLTKGPTHAVKEVVRDGVVHRTGILHVAAQYGHFCSCQELVKEGSDVLIENEDGDTPFVLAALKGYKEVCKLLHQAKLAQLR